ncbi:MAG TPA: PIG-L family deacetylase [Candidatus Limnocylindrales bacterium]|nr:PIG-L family deacetylase [Candidatus Limnocylindrales bacterium]
MNILAVGAHPDDIEILCAGTLARYAKQGHHIYMASFTCGDMGDLEIPPTELARIRKAEAEASAAIIGAQLLWPAITDELVFPNEDQRRIMIDLLRQADPDVILTHSPNDYHPDHRYVSQLVFDSYFQKGLPHLPNQRLPACRFAQAQVYYMDNLGGIAFEPAEYVDITEVLETKDRMLRCHQSQLKAMKDLARTNIVEMVRIQASFRGLAAGCPYAEAFRRLEAFQRGLTRRILP